MGKEDEWTKIVGLAIKTGEEEGRKSHSWGHHGGKGGDPEVHP